MSVPRFLDGILQPCILMVILIHWAMAITLVFINKQLVSGDSPDQDLTVFITWAQCVFSVITIIVATATKRCLIPNTSWLGIPLLTFIHSDVLAMTFTFIGVVVMNNLLLKHIGVAFYQVARSSTLIFTVIFARVFLGVKISLRVVISCFLIVVGFIISVDQEMLITSLSWIGVFYGVLASLFAALSGIYIKRVDELMHGNSLEISLTNNVNSLVFLFPLMLSTGQIHSAIHSSHLSDVAVWLRLAVTGVLSLFVGWASIKVISLTSPVTHHVSINAKSLLQTLIAVLLAGESKTVTWWFGNLLVMLGLINYGLTKTPQLTLRELEISAPAKVNQAKSRGPPTHKETWLA